VGGALLALIEMVSAKMRIFRAPEFLGIAFLLACWRCWCTCCWSAEMLQVYGPQLVNLLAAMMLLLAFAMLAQRRIISLITCSPRRASRCSCRPRWSPG